MQGKTISGYTLQRHLGTGGMAEVWYAENKIGKMAAVKLLLPKLCDDDNVKSRFLTEAKVMVELNHPNIRQVYDYGDIDGRPAIVMEYLDGDDLKTKLKRGHRFTEEELKKWWNQLVAALNYTHQKGIVHRDIKPGNIFVDREGNIKLLDFGIAKVRESISSTQTGQKLGTLMYMSPEQVKDSKHIDYRTDFYSLAVTFVHLITGKRPYDSDTNSNFEISEQIVYKPLDLSGVPMAWRNFLSPYLEKAAQNRPALRPFEMVAEPPVDDANDEMEDTIGASPGSGTASWASTPTSKGTGGQTPPSKGGGGIKKDSPTPTDKPKSKKSLWISLGVAVAAVVALLVLLLKPKQEPAPTDPDTQAYEACQTVADYRAYMRDFGRNALHYAEAQQFVKDFVADSTAKAEEDAVYMQCTSIAACENYLKTYPKGKYVDEVKAKKAKMEEKAQQEADKKEAEAYRKCTTIAACDSYLKTYPKGKYVDEVKAKKAEMEEKEKEERTTQTQISSCFEDNMEKGKKSYNERCYNKAIKYFELAKTCPDTNKAEANLWIKKCMEELEEKPIL